MSQQHVDALRSQVRRYPQARRKCLERDLEMRAFEKVQKAVKNRVAAREAPLASAAAALAPIVHWLHFRQGNHDCNGSSSINDRAYLRRESTRTSE
jgi:hypothetical protein